MEQAVAADAYIGVENYLLSLKPAPLRWFLRLDGAQTDKQRGIENLNATAERPSPRSGTGPALELRGVSAKGDGGHLALEDVNLIIAAGELVGVAGVSGNGQRELYEVALGLRPLAGGRVLVGGTDLAGGGPRAAIDAGGVGIPEDPVADAVVPGLSVAEHMALADLKSVRKGLGIDWAKVRTRLQELDLIR